MNSGRPAGVDLEAILEQAPFGLTIADPNGQRVYSNQQGNLCSPSLDTQSMRELRFVSETGGRTFTCSFWLELEPKPPVDEEIFRLAFFDELTGLPNKTLLARTIGAELQGQSDAESALMLIDLDGLGRTNDYYGAAFADGLIAAFAERLAACVRRSDILGYLANGMFCVFVTDLSDFDLTEYANTILNRSKEPFQVKGVETFSSASIGISMFAKDGSNFEELLVAADQALRGAKSESKGRVGYKPEKAVGNVHGDMSVEQRLRTALRDRKLCCAYQPKVDIHTNGVVSVETLLRWRDDDGQLRVLGDFVNLATDAGIIDAVAEHVVDEVMSSLPQIDSVFSPGTSISLNITAHQSTNPEFMSKLLRQLTSYHRPQRFILEITEEAFLNGDLLSKNIMPMVREAGVKVSIDDFGVGYSSLSALAAVTADELKIDRSFVQNVHQRPRSQSVLKAIESLGRALGMALVIEGVETREEVDYLRQNTAIRIGQGYYFSKPFALEEFVLEDEALPPARQPEAARTHTPTRIAGSRSPRQHP
ncbi:putative bifunctional diguanylate cyclase/phosphodiesterase [Nitratireductor kimnyeongensis]|uniref:Bifunctional diguanylate cyclase/phosphodiesterase n=1 Tax=Nitratireductor kimnyeongensis TaxID=430679 RepID=A0ABW0TCE9_9HYPH|nr:bifunctional diguanylate cyclase/phosphodiesterase [Nitratireductor kimnyeongensis]QZZ37688.1 bifunctional diguanylate cyclase/phosphodiesterase [Nitratireductor kimnyeongensis]